MLTYVKSFYQSNISIKKKLTFVAEYCRVWQKLQFSQIFVINFLLLLLCTKFNRIDIYTAGFYIKRQFRQYATWYIPFKYDAASALTTNTTHIPIDRHC